MKVAIVATISKINTDLFNETKKRRRKAERLGSISVSVRDDSLAQSAQDLRDHIIKVGIPQDSVLSFLLQNVIYNGELVRPIARTTWKWLSTKHREKIEVYTTETGKAVTTLIVNLRKKHAAKMKVTGCKFVPQLII